MRPEKLSICTNMVMITTSPSRSHDDFESVSFQARRAAGPGSSPPGSMQLGTNIFRAKGFVRFAAAESPVLVHLVGSRRSVEPAPAGVETQGVSLVVIGQNSQFGELQAGLENAQHEPNGGICRQSPLAQTEPVLSVRDLRVTLHTAIWSLWRPSGAYPSTFDPAKFWRSSESRARANP